MHLTEDEALSLAPEITATLLTCRECEHLNEDGGKTHTFETDDGTPVFLVVYKCPKCGCTNQNGVAAPRIGGPDRA